MNVNVINERDINSTDANRLVHNRFPSVYYRKEYGTTYRCVDYNDIWGNLGLHNASLTSLFNLKRICVKAKNSIENYNKYSDKGCLNIACYYLNRASLKAAAKAGIITGTPATKEHINKRYVNMDDPNDVITIDRWERKKATYYARPDVDYNAIIEELNKAIRGTLEVYNG